MMISKTSIKIIILFTFIYVCLLLIPKTQGVTYLLDLREKSYNDICRNSQAQIIHLLHMSFKLFLDSVPENSTIALSKIEDKYNLLPTCPEGGDCFLKKCNGRYSVYCNLHQSQTTELLYDLSIIFNYQIIYFSVASLLITCAIIFVTSSLIMYFIYKSILPKLKIFISLSLLPTVFLITYEPVPQLGSAQ